MTVKDLADRIDVSVKDVLAKLLTKRLMMTINSPLDTETATMLSGEFGLIGTERAILSEHGAVRSLNEAAFGRTDEADLIDRLRTEGAVLASFVAECDKRIVGHVPFRLLPSLRLLE
jgi:hypothetical protein